MHSYKSNPFHTQTPDDSRVMPLRCPNCDNLADAILLDGYLAIVECGVCEYSEIDQIKNRPGRVLDTRAGKPWKGELLYAPTLISSQ
jgi:hypothetical protein